MKKILAVGGSENTIDDENRDYHYLTRLQKFGDYDINNISVGGISADEMFYRIIPEIEQNEYDFVLILCVPIGREWVYFSDNNVDDFTKITNGHVSGFNKDSSACRQYALLHYAYFNNTYVKTRRYLSQLLLLQNYFKVKNIPIVMYRDGGDFIDDLLKVEYSEEAGFINMSSSLKEFLDFNNRPDDYILKKLNVLKLLVEKIDRSNWIDFENFKFATSKVDRQRDGVHAGPVTHDNFLKILLSELTKRKLI